MADIERFLASASAPEASELELDPVAACGVGAGGEVQPGHALRYDTEVDLGYTNTSQYRIVMMTGWNKRVLEFGPATGATSKVLKERGCRVTGVEIDPQAAALASQHCERMITGNVEAVDLDAELGSERFDVILFADVLEHLADPARILRRVKGLLAPGGYVCASIPNVTHGSVRLALLAGAFPYSEAGLLDRTHLRFFDRKGVGDLFDRAGYRVCYWDNVDVDIFSTEMNLNAHDYPVKLVEAICSSDDYLTYQFVVRADPHPDLSLVSAAPEDLEVEPVQSAIRRTFKPLWDQEVHAWEMEVKAEGLRRTLNHIHADLSHHLAEARNQLGNVQHAYDNIVNRTNYQLWQRFVGVIDRIAPWGTRRRRLVLLPGYAVRLLMEKGPLGFAKHGLKVWRWGPKLLRREIDPGSLSPGDRYEAWERLYVLSPDHVRKMLKQLKQLDYQPKVSIVMPVYNTEPKWLAAAIDSVMTQVYPNWELCIADDGSSREDTRATLAGYAARDERIKLMLLPMNRGIAAASSAALALATGEFVGLLDHDDELKLNALYQVIKLLNEQRDLDFIYSDLDHRSEEGVLKDPFRKPDWSPDLVTSCNYVTHFSVYRRSIVEQVGGFRPGFDGSQDWDLVLRVTEASERIGHIRAALYTWRQIASSVAHSDDQKPWAHDAARRAIAASLVRRGVDAAVEDGPYPGYYRIRYALLGTPKVSIVIPTRDRLDLLQRCVESIRKLSTWPNYEIVVVDNDSQDESTLAYLQSYGGRVVRHPGGFNFSSIINHGAAEAGGEYIVLLNNDTVVKDPGWIEAMLEHAQRPEVGVVGARLLYPDGRAQHEGVIVGPGDGLAGNIDYENYFGLGRCIHNASAVTAACLMTRRAVFEELGGFEEALTVAYNDVDFCLRASAKGYRIVYTPYAELWHHEAASRGLNNGSHRSHPLGDEDFFRARWQGYRDPFDPPSLKMDLPLIPQI
ncbi:MAG: glycosyltransferase [Actinomycetota bacterium]